MTSWKRQDGGFQTGHWTRFNSCYATGSTVPPINFRTDIQRICPQWTMAFNPERNPSGGQLELDNVDLADHSWENWPMAIGFKSRHAGGAQFLFADGSVHLISENIRHDPTYQYLGCRNDGQVIGRWQTDEE